MAKTKKWYEKKGYWASLAAAASVVMAAIPVAAPFAPAAQAAAVALGGMSARDALGAKPAP